MGTPGDQVARANTSLGARGEFLWFDQTLALHPSRFH